MKEKGVKGTLFKMPTNYPPRAATIKSKAHKCLKHFARSSYTPTPHVTAYTH